MMEEKRDTTSVERSATAKVARRILPYLFLLYIIAFIDRVNFGYAALQMDADLGMGDRLFGLCAGIFFVGYFICEVPSNILMRRIGARRWISRILMSWGLVVVLTGFACSARQLVWLRLALGVAEAGFFPGMVLYLTCWFRAKDRARAIAFFMTALAASNIIGAPVSTWLLDHTGWLGLQGWRWLFILEGLPAMLLGVFNWFYMTDSPAQAGWLTEEERLWLKGELDREHASCPPLSRNTIIGALTSRRVLLFSAIYFSFSVGLYTSAFWLPQAIKAFGNLSHEQIGLLAAIPYCAGAASMILWARHSDKTGERPRHAAAALFAGALGFLLAGAAHSPAMSIAALTLAIAGLYSAYGPFWSLPAIFLRGDAAAAGIAMINSIGNLGGFAGPYILGALKEKTGSARPGWLFTAAALACGAILLCYVRLHTVQETTHERKS